MKVLVRYFKNIIKKYIKKTNMLKYGSVGREVTLQTSLKNISNPKNIFLGDFVSLGTEVTMYATPNSKIIIGNGTIIAPRCKLITSNHNYDSNNLLAIPFDNKNFVKDITIGEGVWIGDSVLILPGINIGSGAVIGGGSVVTKDVPKYAIVAGNPARIIKYRDAEKFNKLLEARQFNKSVDWRKYGGKSFLNN